MTGFFFFTTLCMCGMAWLSQATAASDYLTAVALPMLLIGMGQGLTLGPLTFSGIKGVAAPTQAPRPAW